MPYDPASPDQNLALQASDDVLRADKTFLKNGLEREHHFDGSETAGSGGEHLKHKQGSARVWIYDSATELTTGALASTYSLSNARNTGLVVVDRQAGRAWWCWDGAADEWIELSKLGGALEVLGDLTVGGDVQLATTKKLKVIAGEAFIEDDQGTPVTLNPFTHGARHRPGGTDGAWTASQDFVPYSLQRILSSSALLNGAAIVDTPVIGSQSFGAAGAAKCSLTFSTAGRPTTSRGLLYAEVTTIKQAGTGDIGDDTVLIGAYLDAIGTRLGELVYRCFEDNTSGGGGDGHQTHSFMRLVSGLTAGAHQIALHAQRSAAGAVSEIVSVLLIYLDLGTE